MDGGEWSQSGPIHDSDMDIIVQCWLVWCWGGEVVQGNVCALEHSSIHGHISYVQPKNPPGTTTDGDVHLQPGTALDPPHTHTHSPSAWTLPGAPLALSTLHWPCSGPEAPVRSQPSCARWKWPCNIAGPSSFFWYPPPPQLADWWAEQAW